jgi:hypothetical protein
LAELKQNLAMAEGMFWCSLRGLFSLHHPACSAVISVWRNFKEYRRAQAGRLEKSMRSIVRFAAASTLGHGMEYKA